MTQKRPLVRSQADPSQSQYRGAVLSNAEPSEWLETVTRSRPSTVTGLPSGPGFAITALFRPRGVGGDCGSGRRRSGEVGSATGAWPRASDIEDFARGLSPVSS
jgi:hypothetical protein